MPVVFGNVLACICWRRGQLALHGSAVAIDGRVVLLLGRVATGKSVLAAALARRGHIVLSDEVATVANGQCFSVGAAPLQLADDALLAAGIDPEPLPLYSNFPIPKRHWTGGPAPQPWPYPVRGGAATGQGRSGRAGRAGIAGRAGCRGGDTWPILLDRHAGRFGQPRPGRNTRRWRWLRPRRSTAFRCRETWRAVDEVAARDRRDRSGELSLPCDELRLRWNHRG